MAPRFKYNMFKVYDNGSAYDNGSCAAICFAQESYDKIFDLREHLTEEILRQRDVFVQKDKGSPTPIDSSYKFFISCEKELVENFYKIKRPGFWAMIFKLKKWKLYTLEHCVLIGKTILEIETSHDFPCLVINKNEIFTKDELINLIKEQSDELNLNFKYDENLPDMASFMISNMKFGY